MSGTLSEKGVSNHPGHRQISNWCDDHFLNDHQEIRCAIHGIYHDIVGAAKLLIGNTEGANAEWKRAGDQFSKAKSSSPPPQ